MIIITANVDPTFPLDIPLGISTTHLGYFTPVSVTVYWQLTFL